LGEQRISARELALVELLDRVLHKGAVLSADITLSVADVDLVYLSLRGLVASAETARALSGGGRREPDGRG
jgi:gas vesicle structural protein